MKHKIVAGIAIFEGLLLLLLFLVWQLDDGQGLFGGCGGEIYSSAKSPDKKWVAYAFERDCGATTGFASWVIIRSADQKLDLSEPLEQNEIVFGADGDFHPRLRWTGKDDLQIVFSPGEMPTNKDISYQVLKMGDWRIEYQGTAR